MKAQACALRWFTAPRARRRHHANGAAVALGITLLAPGPGMAIASETPAVTGAASHECSVADFFPGDDELIICEVFRRHLPATPKEHARHLSLHPHLGDFRDKDHLRVTPGIRYGATKNWGISLSSDLYASHGRGDIPSFDHYGAASVELGAKVNLRQIILDGWEIGTGFTITPEEAAQRARETPSVEGW